MSSAKYLGYLSGAAVAAGVGAAIAVSGQGTAYAETDGGASSSPSAKSESSSSESAPRSSASDSSKSEARDSRSAAKAARAEAKAGTKTAPDADGVDAGPKRSDRPKFDPAEAVRDLTKQFGTTRTSKAKESDAADTKDVDTKDVDTKDLDETTDEQSPAPTEPSLPTEPAEPIEPAVPNESAEPIVPDDSTVPAESAPAPKPVFDPTNALAAKAKEAFKVSAALAGTQAQDGEQAAGPVPWSPNPFRPMPPEPVPNDMPAALWNVEQSLINAFRDVPFLQPFVREGYEAAFRGSQMIPWVNAVIPVINIVNELPNLNTGDPVLFRDATQRIVNNLLVTIHPISVIFYGYDQIADLINLEYEAQQLKEAFYVTTWNILDPFGLLHNRGSSGLPLSPSAATDVEPSQGTSGAVRLAAAVGSSAAADAPGSDPFRADDPDPIGMPQVLIQARNIVMAFLPSPLREVYREGFELVYRTSQMVPMVNAVLPATEILPALFHAFSGNKAAAQIAVNQLLLTTGPVSFLYYGYDQIADLLNVEQTAHAAKQQFYADLWDAIDPNFLLHHQGQSGLRYA